MSSPQHAYVFGDDDKHAKFAAAQKSPAGSLKVVAPQMQSSPPAYSDDDKYAKFGAAQKQVPEPFQKYHKALSIFNLHGGMIDERVAKLLVGFLSFMLAAAAAYTTVGGTWNSCKASKFVSVGLEVLGLLMLRHKIMLRNNVNGISGQSMVMYAVVYFVRIFLSMPGSWDFEWKDVDFDAWFAGVSLILDLSIIYSIFATHRSSYQDDLDMLKVKYLIPACFFLALLVRPHFHQWDFMYGYTWSSCFYIDIFALVPQVVMMAQGGGKVEAPIAHFVAATFLSRMGDIWDSLMYENDLRVTDNVSFWTVVVGQGLHLLLVADFMYYYMKARTSGAKLLEDINLAADNNC